MKQNPAVSHKAVAKLACSLNSSLYGSSSNQTSCHTIPLMNFRM